MQIPKNYNEFEALIKAGISKDKTKRKYGEKAEHTIIEALKYNNPKMLYYLNNLVTLEPIDKEFTKVLQKYNLHKNYGVDIFIKVDNKYYIVQVKYTNDNYKNDHKFDLSTFYHFINMCYINEELANYIHMDKFYFICNLEDTFILKNNMNRNGKELFEVFGNNELRSWLSEEFFNCKIQRFEFDIELLKQYKPINSILNIEIKLTDKQKEIVESSISELETNHKVSNILPCGFGKTVISIAIGAYYLSKGKSILILAPTKELIKQTQKAWKKYLNYEVKIAKDERFESEQNDSLVYISTYMWCKNLVDIKFDLCIFDEAHRTAGISKDGKDRTYSSLLESDNITDRLFLTATKKLIDKKYYKYIDVTELYDMNNKKIYGNDIIVTFNEALKLNRIADYRVICYTDYIKNNTLKDKDIMKINLIEDVMIYHCKNLIVFCKDTYEVYRIQKEYLEIFPERKFYYIFGTTPEEERERILNIFNTCNDIVLFSIRVLSEGYDTSKCDGVFIYNNIESSILIIQEIGRGQRWASNKLNKIIVPIIYDDEDFYDVNNGEYRKLRSILLTLKNETKESEEIKNETKEIDKVVFINLKETINKIHKVKEYKEIETDEMIEQIGNNIKTILFDPTDRDIKYYEKQLIKIYEKENIYFRDLEEYENYPRRDYYMLPDKNTIINLLHEKNTEVSSFLLYNRKNFYTKEELKILISRYNNTYLTNKQQKELFNNLLLEDRKIPVYYEDFYSQSFTSFFENQFLIL